MYIHFYQDNGYIIVSKSSLLAVFCEYATKDFL